MIIAIIVALLLLGALCGWAYKQDTKAHLHDEEPKEYKPRYRPKPAKVYATKAHEIDRKARPFRAKNRRSPKPEDHPKESRQFRRHLEQLHRKTKQRLAKWQRRRAG